MTSVKHTRIMLYLKQIAKKSDMRCKHAAAVVNSKGEIISTGYNRQASYTDVFPSIHAERDALNKCGPDNVSGCDLYVIRWGVHSGNPEFMMSAPCKICTPLINKYMSKYNLRRAYYSTPSNIRDGVCIECV